MKFRPILFSTPMVEAILNGTKKQTRRIIKPQPIIDEDSGYVFFKDHQLDIHNWKELLIKEAKAEIEDVFWVRETFSEAGNFASYEFDNSEVIAYKTKEAFFYDNKRKLDTEYWNWQKMKWKPSIFMPKDVCRIFLKVKNVRIERLHDISDSDAKDEGILMGDYWGEKSPINYMYGNEDGFKREYFIPDAPYGMEKVPTHSGLKASFFTLWWSINGKKSLEENPYVWVYDFEEIEKPLEFSQNYSKA